jgi:hypothetical protein
MDATFISTAAAAILSLLFSYLPGLSEWYARLGSGPGGEDGGTRKRLLMLALLVLVAGGAFGLTCAGWGDLLGAAGAGLRCDRPGLVELLRALFFALMANQSVYKISPKKKPATESLVSFDGPLF